MIGCMSLGQRLVAVRVCTNPFRTLSTESLIAFFCESNVSYIYTSCMNITHIID